MNIIYYHGFPIQKLYYNTHKFRYATLKSARAAAPLADSNKRHLIISIPLP